MNLRCANPQLARMDELEATTLVVAHFGDERPLTGVGGLVDWRFNGFLSRLVLAEKLDGSWGEQLLYPIPRPDSRPPRLPFQKLLVVGLGERQKYGSSRFKEVSARILRTLQRLDVHSFATVLPGRDSLKLAPRQMMELWLSEFHKVFVAPRVHDLMLDVVFLEPPDPTGEVKEMLSQFSRQYGPPRSR